MSSAYQVNQQPNNATPKQESITGVVERLTFHSSESGYTVARLQRPKVSELTTITGSFAGIQPGQTLQLNGFWREHPQYGLHVRKLNCHELVGSDRYKRGESFIPEKA
jgi:exodeoxyribonuclease V alpha subunit